MQPTRRALRTFGQSRIEVDVLRIQDVAVNFGEAEMLHNNEEIRKKRDEQASTLRKLIKENIS